MKHYEHPIEAFVKPSQHPVKTLAQSYQNHNKTLYKPSIGIKCGSVIPKNDPPGFSVWATTGVS